MALRVVLDTNVLVSALMRGKGPPREIEQLWCAGLLEICTSVPLMDELRGVIFRPRVRRFLRLTGPQLERWLDGLSRTALVIPEGRLHVQCVVPEDPADDVVLATAVAAGADAIVSGDAHLRGLRSHLGIPVLSPRELVAALGQGGGA